MLKIIKIVSKSFSFGLLTISLIACSTPQKPINTNPNDTTVSMTNQVKHSEAEIDKNSDNLTDARANWQKNNHIHSIAVYPNNPHIIYAATHHGIFLRNETGKWFQLGNNRSDFMSFIADPIDPNKLYGSGHPPQGGNMGFIISEDGGKNWQEKSLPGVDFHGLAISPSQPHIFYGWIASAADGKKGLFLSNDSGKTWQKQQENGLRDHPLNLVVDPINSKRIFATARIGIYQSQDSGNNWQLIPSTVNIPIVALFLTKESDKVIMYGYRLLESNSGIIRSEDYGKTWELITNQIEGIILNLTNALSQPDIFYATNDKNIIFQSLDRGKTWQKIN